MTRQETGIVMDILQTAYPRFYAGAGAPDRLRTLDLWAEMFADDDVALVAAAVKALIASDEKGFPPHIGAVKNAMHSLADRDGPDEAGAWDLVRRAVSDGIYGAEEGFRRLPEEIRRIVGSPSQLREWAVMDSGTLHSVVASNFQRAYRARRERARLESLLPADVRRAVSGIAARTALGDGAAGGRKCETGE